MKRCFKQVLSGIIYYSGLLCLVKFLSEKLCPSTAVIFCFHRVIEGDPDVLSIPGAQADLYTFRSILRRLQGYYDFIPLANLVQRLKNNDIQKRMGVLTFDDGFKDSYSRVLPTLKDFGLPAAFFVSPALMGSKSLPFYGEIRFYFEQPALPAHIWWSSGDIPLKNAIQKQEAIGRMIVFFSRATPADRGRLLSDVRSATGVAPPNFESEIYASREEVKSIGREPLYEIGAHSMTHPRLDACSAADLDFEISGSKTQLESLLQRPVLLFAYPFGSHSDPVVSKLRQSGFEAAVTTRDGLVQFGDDPLLLNRVSVVRDDTFLSIMGWKLAALYFRQLVIGLRKRWRTKGSEKPLRNLVSRIETESDSQKRIRVVHLVEWLEIGGGLETTVYNLVTGMDQNRYEVQLWCLAADGKLAQMIRAKRIRVEVLRLTNYHNPMNVWRLARRLRDNRTQILHTHGYFAGTFGRLAGYIGRTPVMLNHVQSSHWVRPTRHILTDRLLSYITHRTIACSGVAARFLVEKEGINAQKVVTIHNSVDLRRFHALEPEIIESARTAFTIDSGIRVIGTVARLEPVKGVDYLLKAAVKVIARVPNLRVVVVGEGSLKEHLKALSESLGISEKVIFTGTQTDVPLLLNLMDVFVLPSPEREGLPNAVVEAQACCKPVVATHVGGIPEAVIDGTTGSLVPPRDVEALANAIIELLQNGEKARTLGETGRKFCMQQFSLDGMVKQVDQLYSSLLAGEKISLQPCDQ